MNELKKIFENNKTWIEKKRELDPNFFQNLAKEQKPEYLWIGCSDSRVPANEIVGLEAGELFVHRNIANLCIHTDMNCLSVLEYAVDVLNIKHVIVCGHYNCGGILAALKNQSHGVVDYWLCSIKNVYEKHKNEIDAISDFQKRFDRLVELNVKQQVLNVCNTPTVKKAWKRKQPLKIHGLVYDLKIGNLKDLDICISNIEQIESVYRTNS